jgi:hypothetical protein
MQSFVDDLDQLGNNPNLEQYSDFRLLLGRITMHPNRRYFIFKSIILNNLFGVDIMEEAVEICKLRLFLKLASEVEPDGARANLGIDPLPDIDFNIKAGNTLVGFSTFEETNNVIRSRLDFENIMDRIVIESAKLESSFNKFRNLQVSENSGVPSELKEKLQDWLSTLQNELNRFFAAESGIESTQQQAFSDWLNSHQPFHWFLEFYGVMNDGGFDIIIGNPPYVEYDAKQQKKYRVAGYQTLACGNLHAFCAERCLNLIAPPPFVRSTKKGSTRSDSFAG